MKLSITIDDSDLRAAVARLKGGNLNRGIIAIMERRGNEARKEAVGNFTSHGLGRALFGRNNRGAFKSITLTKPRAVGSIVAMTLQVVGLAALQDTGGRIKPHVIRPKRKDGSLAFAAAGGFGFGGDTIFAKVVNHPGASVPRYPFSAEAAKKAGNLAAADIDRLITGLWSGRAA